MQLSRLRINRLPGLEKPFELETRPGINLITGPNGSGKSSLARAVFHLLWPDLQEISTPCDVVADFHFQDQAWQAVDQDGRSVQWWHENEPAERPFLPATQVALSYRLGMRDLNPPELGDDDLKLARQIRKQMDGGFDLASTGKALFTLSSRTGMAEGKKLQDARKEVGAIQTRYFDLSARQRALEQKEKLWQQARSAESRRSLLLSILDQRRKQAELQDLQTRLDEFPPGVAFVTDDDPDSLKNWRHQEQKCLRQQTDLTGTLEELQAQRLELSLPDDNFSLELLVDLVESLKSAQVNRTNTFEKLAGLRYVLGDEDELAEGQIPLPVDRATFNKLLELHAALLKLDAKQMAWEDQLAAQDSPSATASLPAWMILLSGLAVMAFGIWGLGTFSTEQNSHLWSLLPLALGALGAAAGTFLLGKTRRTNPGERAADPKSKLENLASERAVIYGELEDLAQRHQLDLDNPDLIHDLKTLSRRHDDQQDQNRILGQVQQCDEELAQALKTVNNQLELAGVPLVDSPETARQAVNDLDRRLKELDRLDGEIKTSLLEIDNTRENLNQAIDSLAAIFKRLRLEPETESDPMVAELAKMKSARENTRLEIAAVTESIQTIERAIQDQANLLDVAEARAQTSSELGDRIAREMDSAQTEVDLQTEIADIKNDIKTARGGDSLEKARAREENSRQALADKREQARRAALGSLILGQVRQQSEMRSRPPVLQEARQLFQTFTGNRYELLATRDPNQGSGFRARDNDNNQTLELSQLSDGTRAQLLLAVRLGFIFQSESDCKPPLFLDDSLTSSDPARFAAIAANLGQLAQERDRQIIFLTPAPTDVSAWNRALANKGLPPAHTIDLGQVRQLAAMANSADLKIDVIPEIPSPANHSPAQYGELLQVPTLDTWLPASAAHPFYLLTDQLQQLHSLLLAGCSTLGRWKVSRQKLVAGKILTEAEDELLAIRQEILSALLEAWQVGRSRPVQMSDIMATGAVSGTMRAKVAEVLEECRGDGQAFMEALRQGKVKRFQDSKKDQLQAYLELEGFLDSRNILTSDGLIQQVVAATSHRIRSGAVTLREIRTLVLGWAEYLSPRAPDLTCPVKNRSDGSDRTR